MNIHKTRHNLFRLATALAALAMLVLSSCASDNDEAQDADGKTVVVVFQLSIPRTENASTRSATDATAAGNELEHRLRHLHVVLYATDGTFIAQEEGLRITPLTTSTAGNYEYTANVEVSMQIPDRYRTSKYTPFTGELVVYANTDIPASAGYTSADISALTFRLSSNTDPDALPMWGMRNITAADNVKLTAGTRNDLTSGTAIDLMRSVAKVTVDLTEEMVDDGWTFETLKLTKYNTEGYVLPKGYFSGATAPYTFYTATRLMTYPDDDNTARFNPYTAADGTLNGGALDDLYFNDGTTATAGKTLYIPEYDNTSTGVTPATIDLTLLHKGVRETDDNGNQIAYRLRFANYNSETVTHGDYDHLNGSDFNIVRNTWYQYHLYKLSEHKIGVTLTVKPWYYVEHAPIVM